MTKEVVDRRSFTDSKDEILLSRAFLEACLEERVSQNGPVVLDAYQRQFLELIATSAPFKDVITVPKKHLEAFLAAKK